MSTQPTIDRASLEAFCMPFTANRQFKAHPRLLARASGMHYWTPEGRQVLDGGAGLWCKRFKPGAVTLEHDDRGGTTRSGGRVSQPGCRVIER